MANIDVSAKLGFPSPEYAKNQSSSVSPGVNNTVYLYDLSAGPYSLTLPIGTTAMQIGAIDKNSSATPLRYLDVIPGVGGTIRGAADTYRFRTKNFSVMFYREEGSSDWQMDANFNNRHDLPGTVRGQVNGTAIAAGKIGERITWTTPPGNQTLTTGVADWTNATFTLTPGVWKIHANICGSATTGTTAANHAAWRVLLTDSAGATVQSMDRRSTIATPVAASSAKIDMINMVVIVNISVSTLYKLRVVLNNIAGTNSGQVLNSTNNLSEFFAMRIA